MSLYGPRRIIPPNFLFIQPFKIHITHHPIRTIFHPHSFNLFIEYNPFNPAIFFGFLSLFILSNFLNRLKFFNTNSFEPIIPESVKYRVLFRNRSWGVILNFFALSLFKVDSSITAPLLSVSAHF